MTKLNDQVINKKMEQFFSGVDRLFDVLTPEIETEYRNDAVIQRFKVCYEMSWKLLKRLLEDNGIIENTPKDVFKSAFTAGYIGTDVEGWYLMIKSRNLTSHVYNEMMAENIVKQIEIQYVGLLKQLCSFIKENFYGN